MSIQDLINKKKRESKVFREAFEAPDLAFDVGNRVLEARIIAGFTQAKLAKKVGTKQPSIARVESGDRLPSLSFLEKIANALGTELVAPSFASIEEKADQRTDSMTTDSQITVSDIPVISPLNLEFISLSQ